MKIIRFCFVFLLSSCVFWPNDYSNWNGGDSFKEGVTAFNTSRYALALEKLKEPAERGNIDAQYLMGLIYRYGLTGEKNSFLAEKYLNMAANNGQTAAQVQLAFLYQDRNAPLYNPLAAYRWFEIVVGSRPQYQQELQNLRWTLQTQGLLLKVKSLDIPDPKFVYYRGVDYNDLFPPR